jgi:ribosome-binding factor A
MMALSKRARDKMLAHCGEIHEDDGVDPREFFKAGRQGDRQNRKAKQLCRQVAETLEQVLAGEVGDDLLRGLHVASVLPAPDASRLLVTVEVDRDSTPEDREAVELALVKASGLLRTAVAAAITRRKAPSLSFCVRGASTPTEREGSV